jgi:predicted CoA-binding protein
MIDPIVVQEFLAQRRIALVGASDDPRSFGRTVYCALRDHGHDVVAVNPNYETVAGDRCYPDLASVTGDIDGLVVMVHRDRAADVVRAAAERGIPRVWLFKGLGAPGAVSEEALHECALHGIAVVAGACPLMFLEPVGGFHRLHRAARRMNGSLARVPSSITRDAAPAAE